MPATASEPFGPTSEANEEMSDCGQTIYHICGKFMTRNRELGDLDQKAMVQGRACNNVKANIRDDWKDEQDVSTRIQRDAYGLATCSKSGRTVRTMPTCKACWSYWKMPKLKPECFRPYDGCRHETCEFRIRDRVEQRSCLNGRGLPNWRREFQNTKTEGRTA